MPPIRMTRDERAALSRLAQQPSPPNGFSTNHQRRLISSGLAIREGANLRITTKGRLELLRQRFRSLDRPASTSMSAHDFIARLEEEIAVLNAQVVAERRSLSAQRRY